MCNFNSHNTIIKCIIYIQVHKAWLKFNTIHLIILGFLFILHKRFVIRSCTCTDVRCIIYLLCKINNFVISNKNN